MVTVRTYARQSCAELLVSEFVQNSVTERRAAALGPNRVCK